jgi:hypothetical protein
VVAHPHWTNECAKAARQGGVDVSLGQAVEQVNAWIAHIEVAHPA